MEGIAQRILAGMAQEQIDEVSARSIVSVKDCSYPKGVHVLNIRAAAGMIIGPEDLNEKRKFLRKNIPRCLQKRKKDDA